MKTWMRRPTLFMMAAFLVVLAAGFTFANSSMSRAHAATATPTITVSAHTVRPRQKITVTGQGFAPNDTVTVFLDQPVFPFGNLTCDGKTPRRMMLERGAHSNWAKNAWALESGRESGYD